MARNTCSTSAGASPFRRARATACCITRLRARVGRGCPEAVGVDARNAASSARRARWPDSDATQTAKRRPRQGEQQVVHTECFVAFGLGVRVTRHASTSSTDALRPPVLRGPSPAISECPARDSGSRRGGAVGVRAASSPRTTPRTSRRGCWPRWPSRDPRRDTGRIGQGHRRVAAMFPTASPDVTDSGDATKSVRGNGRSAPHFANASPAHDCGPCSEATSSRTPPRCPPRCPGTALWSRGGTARPFTRCRRARATSTPSRLRSSTGSRSFRILGCPFSS